MSYKNHAYFIFVVSSITAYPSLVVHHDEQPFFYDVSSNYCKEHIFAGGSQ